MKKIISAICAAALLLTLAGCSKKDTLHVTDDEPQNIVSDSPIIAVDNPDDLELQKISELRGDIDRQIESVRSAGYKNLNVLDNFTVSLPETDVLYELELAHPKLTFQDYYDKFDRIFDRDFGDIYSPEDKTEIYLATAIDDDFESDDYAQITLAERTDKFESGELKLSWLFIETNKAYMEMYSFGNGVFRLYHDGVITRAEPDKEPTTVCFTDAYRHFGFVKEALDVNSDDKYALLDGEMSVNEAAEEVKRLVVEHEYTWGGDLSPEVYEYRVYDLGDGKFGLEFMLAPSYKGVMFDKEDVFEKTDVHLGADMDRLAHDYIKSSTRAFIMESGQIETFLYGDSAYDVTELAEHDSVVPLDKAVEIASEKFGTGMDLWLGSAELLYSPMYEIADHRTQNGAFPVWKLKLSNSTDGLKYITYINAVTGEFEYYAAKGWVI